MPSWRSAACRAGGKFKTTDTHTNISTSRRSSRSCRPSRAARHRHSPRSSSSSACSAAAWRSFRCTSVSSCALLVRARGGRGRGRRHAVRAEGPPAQRIGHRSIATRAHNRLAAALVRLEAENAKPQQEQHQLRATALRAHGRLGQTAPQPPLVAVQQGAGLPHQPGPEPRRRAVQIAPRLGERRRLARQPLVGAATLAAAAIARVARRARAGERRAVHGAKHRGAPAPAFVLGAHQ